MLNISENSISHLVKLHKYKSHGLLTQTQTKKKRISYALFIVFIILIIIFVPWTQNVNGKGYVTTLFPDQRPQPIHSIISGRLEKWYVREGEYVNKGDTLIHITEVKNDYFDPNLVARTLEQVAAKSESVNSYEQKVNALQSQLAAIKEAQNVKLEQIDNKIIQTKNKILTDSIDLIAYQMNFKISVNQLERVKTLEKQGLKSLSELQEKEIKNQELNAKYNAQLNKLANQKNTLENMYLELSATDQEYAQKIAKTQSDIQSAQSSMLDAASSTAKLKNQLTNYETRQGLYYILAPTSGYITKAIKKGTGQLVKEGTDILTIMPSEYDLAVEVYVKPRDLPLLHLGDHSRLRFDGWPAIVISGWPEASTGIFSGKIVAIDQFISENGLYRVMITPDPTTKAWPVDLRVGTGTYTFILLKDVPVWYELWRNLNGFPPDFYKDDKNKSDEIKLKAPIKSVK